MAQVGERMAGAAPRVEQEKVVGEAQVLQVFEVPDKRAGVSHSVAGCRITDGSLRAAARFRVLRAGTLVCSPHTCLPHMRSDGLHHLNCSAAI